MNEHRPSLIPPQAKRVFQGIVYDTYQWQQEMYDGTFKTFEMLQRRDSVQVIAVTPDKQILVTKQHQPNHPLFLGLAGGGMNAGESPEEAGKRELLEETGYAGSTWELFNTCRLLNRVDWLIYTYVARDCTKVTEPHIDNGEKIEVILMSFEDFLETCLQKEFRDDDFRSQIYEAKLDVGKMRELRRRILGI
jgi:ADP-ribose pyrophosphatase